MPEQFDGLIATVGGSPEPLLKTLANNRPQYVLFVVSEGSGSTVENDILPGMDCRADCDYLVISDPNDMGAKYRELRDSRTGDWLTKHNLDPSDVYLDITGGTKAMSAALALAGVERFSAFSYVGGTNGTRTTWARWLQVPNTWFPPRTPGTPTRCATWLWPMKCWQDTTPTQPAASSTRRPTSAAPIFPGNCNSLCRWRGCSAVLTGSTSFKFLNTSMGRISGS